MGNKDPNDKKGNLMKQVGSESSDGRDECRIEHGCDTVHDSPSSNGSAEQGNCTYKMHTGNDDCLRYATILVG